MQISIKRIDPQPSSSCAVWVINLRASWGSREDQFTQENVTVSYSWSHSRENLKKFLIDNIVEFVDLDRLVMKYELDRSRD